MMFKTHLAFGFLISALFFKLLDISFLFIPIALFAAVFPDIDEANSKIGRKFGILSKILNFFFGHRGIMHSIYIPVLLYLVFYIINQKIIAITILIGYLSHILIDCLTLSGINLLHPFLNLKITGFIETNSFFEFLLFILISIADIYIIIKYIF